MWSVVQRREIRRRVQDQLRLDAAKPPDEIENGIAIPHRRSGVLSSDDSNRKADNGSEDSPSSEIHVTAEAGDPLNPQDWPLLSRSKNLVILSFLIFVQGWAGASGSMESSRASPAFNVSKETENLSTDLYLVGVATGAPFAGPLSETAGRNPTYLISTFIYLCFVLGSAKASTFGRRIACRYLVGLFSSATLATNGSSVRDQFRDVKRALVFPIIAWVNVIGALLPVMLHSSI
jgi:hypothetical protein